MPDTETFSGEIRVTSRIVDYLSSGLYKSPGSCLKELINNSYDADATVVHVLVKPDADSILINDNGVGMDRQEFERHFERVAESHKRDDGDRTATGRKQIGYIGIGFIAANELCRQMHILSTKRGSTDLLDVIIDFETMTAPLSERRRDDGTDLTKADYRGTVGVADIDDHYTKIFLRRVRREARELVVSARRAASREISKNSLYGMTPEQVQEKLADERIKSWDDFDYYSRTMLEVALNVPVAYPDNWIPSIHVDAVSWFTEQAEQSNFRVFYDGTELRKPTVLRPGKDGHSIVQVFDIETSDVRARCYLYAGRHVLKPPQLNGAVIRVRLAAVGEYDPSFMGFPTTQNPLLQRWISGEIWASDALEEAMNIDRRTLRDAHPAYASMKEEFHEALLVFLRRARAELHDKPVAARRRIVAEKEIGRIKKSLREEVKQKDADRIVELVERQWKWRDDVSSRRSLTRKYSVSEIYTLVAELTRRLSG